MPPTKGPWKVMDLDGRLPVVRQRKMPHGEASTFHASITSAAGAHVCGLEFGYGKHDDEANTLLIAAAPELLDACKAVKEACPCDSDITPAFQAAWDAMCAAVAKAEKR